MNLKALRERCGLTQEELAASADISREYLARLETGRQDPRVSVLARIAGVLGATVDELAGERRRRAMRGPSRQNFEDALTAVLAAPQRGGRSYVDVKAGDLHRRVGGYPSRGGDHRMPLCCQVMRRAMRQGDQILQEPASGQGATFIVRYHLPRS